MKRHLSKALNFLMLFALVGVFLPKFASAATPVTPTYSGNESSYTHLVNTNNNVEKPSKGGQLQVIKQANGEKTLADQNGNPIQLRGMSTHGLQWYPAIINNNAFSAISTDWGANVVRLAMYVSENGFATDPTLEQKVIDGIKLAKANDMYVIVDWHVTTPGDPTAPVYSGAQKFFQDISTQFPNDPNIIYEVANEPSSAASTDHAGITNDAAGWKVVKDYATSIIQSLRASGNQNIVLVGNPNWDQRPDLAADNPINDKNTMYTVHFYTGTHLPADPSVLTPSIVNDPTRKTDNVMENAYYALQKGAPIFVSEFGTSQADGTGGPYLDNADKWLDFLNAHNVSWVNWSLSNKAESSAAFLPYEAGVQDATPLDPGTGKVWSVDQLSVSGEYVRTRILGQSYQPIDRTQKAYSTTVWNFDDGTKQGFDINGDSPNQNIVVSNDNNMLKVTGLDTTDPTNTWGNRIAAGGASVDITGADKMTMDVLADAPATVNIGLIPQGPANNYWTNPANTITVNPTDFTQQSDGKYKATVTITKADAPGLDIIGSSSDQPTLTGVVLLLGSSASTIYLDNITVSGTHKVVSNPVVNDPLGTATLPSTFEDGTRQGWAFDAASGIKDSLTIKDANGSKALSWDATYPGTTPSDPWAVSPRLILSNINTTRGNNYYVTFDLYLKPTQVTKGGLNVQLAFAPPALGYWAQDTDTYHIDLTKLNPADQTADGLYHYKVVFNLNHTDKTIASNTLLRDLTIVIADSNTDFQGTMYLDNVQFTNAPDKVAPTTQAVTDGTQGNNGWFTSNVNVSLNATDTGSGVASTEYSLDNGATWNAYSAPFTISKEGTTHILYRSTDHAGNVEVNQSLTVKIDKTAPTLSLSLNKDTLWSPNHKMVDIQVTHEAKDATSGVDHITLLSVTSNQADNGTGDGNTVNDIQGTEFGTDDTSFQLRAERIGNEARIYTITYEVTDKAGNKTDKSTTVTVPKSK